ncbi:hypothetical protein Taro_012938 [Colocasia esculenta]|uniref:Uncharacterized protein n=1 Tax=Colocasia esculenta TaxID=4460 RepID=A0A843UAL9_COLES|nr:hypothetical protein [Colocasia esculenta]
MPPPLSVHHPTGALRTPSLPACAPPVAVSVIRRRSPSPKSPPTYPDVCGRHQLQVGLQTLNREIGILEALKRAIESGWLMLLEEVGLWIPAEVVNKEIDDKLENEQEPGIFITLTPNCNGS